MNRTLVVVHITYEGMSINDYVFGRIFGYKGNENTAKGLIESITNEKYKSLEIASSVPTIKELQDDKIEILDILIKVKII